MRANPNVPLFVIVLPLIGGCANLAWDAGPKVYAPPPTNTLTVTGLGVNAPVDLLAPAPFSASRTLVNTSSFFSVPPGYLVTDTIVRWVFMATTGSAGWVPGNPATHTVFTQTVPGPALAPGASATVGFGPVLAGAPLPCGLYQQTISVDSGNAVNETSETDNVTTHFFHVPSPQQFNIAVTPLLPAGNVLRHRPPVATPTHTFTVNPAVPVAVLPTPAWVYAHFSFVATEGSTADTLPVPAAPGGPAPQVITMRVTPKPHNPGPSAFDPSVTGKVTVISQDGCVIKQESATVGMDHS